MRAALRPRLAEVLSAALVLLAVSALVDIPAVRASGGSGEQAKAARQPKSSKGGGGHQVIVPRTATLDGQGREHLPRHPPGASTRRNIPRPGMTPAGVVGKDRADRGEARPTRKPTAAVVEPQPPVIRRALLGGQLLRRPNESAIELATPVTSEAAAATPDPAAPTFGGGFLADTQATSIPPDPTLAVGPFNLVTATNDNVRIFSKTGVEQPNSPTALGTFLGSTDNTFDPKLLFDQYINRFWLIAVSRNPNPSGASGTRRSRIWVAVSSTEDANDPWSVFFTDARMDGSENTDNWCDYPQVGIDVAHIYFTCNMFQFGGGFEYSKIRIMTKSQFTTGNCCTWYDFWDMVDVFNASFTIQPAHLYGAGSSTPMFLVNAHGGGGADNELSLWRIREAFHCCDGSEDPPLLDGENYTIGDYDTPPSASQPSGATAIDTGDSRLLYAFWRGSRLSMGQNTACNDGNDSCAAYTEVDLSDGLENPSTIQDFVVGASGFDYYYPSANVNSAGNRTMVYTRSSSTQFASALFLGIPAGAPSCTPDGCDSSPLDGPETTLQAGQSTYVQLDTSNRNRWGDYLGSSVDPDGVGIWIHGEFAAPFPNTWQTQVGLTQEPMDTTPPVTTALVAPAPTSFGWNSGNVIVTLSATDARGVRFLTYSATGAQSIPSTTVGVASVPVFISAEGITTLSFFAQDNWGNIEATKTHIVRIDKTDPVVSCASPDGLWHATNIALSCTSVDGPSGIADPANLSFQLVTSVPLGVETDNALTNTRLVCDRANNCVTAGPIGGNKIDRKPPSIVISTPAGVPVYLLNQVVPSDYACADGGSGVATCAGPVADGAPIDTASVGIKTFQVNATDAVGNASSASNAYKVTYKICLGYDPTKGYPTGGVVPILIALCDVNDVNVSSPSIIVTATSVLPSGALQSPGNNNPGGVFTYLSTGGYLFTLLTKGYTAGNYLLEFQVTGDPIIHTVPFILK